MMLTLYVGGPWDGRRDTLKDGSGKVIRCAEAPSPSWTAVDTLSYAETCPVREHRYIIRRIAMDLAVAVHESLEDTDPLVLLFGRYPHPPGQKVY